MISKEILNHREVCPLCDAEGKHFFLSNDARHFLHCAICDLIFVMRRNLPEPLEERARYLSHNNNHGDEAYERFLNRLYGALQPKLLKTGVGLDFGAGPNDVLAEMIRRDGHTVRVFDPFFFPDKSVLTGHYDFITCSEAAEHFHNPKMEFALLASLLAPGGWLGLQTGMLDSWEGFPGWYYHRDPTHVAFYSKKTMAWIGNRWALVPSFPGPNIVLFQA